MESYKNDDIGNIMDKALETNRTSVQFDNIWTTISKNNQKKFSLKKIIAIPLIALVSLFALCTVGFSAYGIYRNIDKTDYPFVDDPRAIGKWESVDFVNSIEFFDPTINNNKQDLYLKSLVFINDGNMLSSSENDVLAYTSFTWTKDKILNKQENVASKYIISEINGNTYMFFEWKSGDYVFRNMIPKYYVLKKIDSNDYSGYIPKRIKEDKVDYPFVNDASFIGKWETVDFVEKIYDFDPGNKLWQDDLYLTWLEFDANGKLTAKTLSRKISSPSLSWTKGLVINTAGKTASKCEIKEINNETYMFYEWKNGDYVFRGTQPSYYVLKKAK